MIPTSSKYQRTPTTRAGESGHGGEGEEVTLRLLPGEDGNYTRIPNPTLERLLKAARKSGVERDAVLEVHIRQHIGRSNKGKFREGIIQDLSIAKVAAMLGCDSSTATRVRKKVMNELGGVRIGGGDFAFGSAVPDAVLPAVPPAVRIHVEDIQLDSADAVPDAVPTAVPGAVQKALKPAPVGGSSDAQDVQSFQDGQDGRNSTPPPGMGMVQPSASVPLQKQLLPPADSREALDGTCDASPKAAKEISPDVKSRIAGLRRAPKGDHFC